jgi:hypothetical protein
MYKWLMSKESLFCAIGFATYLNHFDCSGEGEGDTKASCHRLIQPPKAILVVSFTMLSLCIVCYFLSGHS